MEFGFYSTSGPVSTGMGDHLGMGKPPRNATCHPGQLSLLPFAGREISTGQSAVMLCGWGVKAGWLIPYVNKRVWVAQVTLCDSSLTSDNLSALERSIAHIIKRHTNCPVYLLTCPQGIARRPLVHVKTLCMTAHPVS